LISHYGILGKAKQTGDKIMGFTETLTIVFIVLKLAGIISWAWWLVLLPEIIALSFYALLLIGYLALGYWYISHD
jgi:hypothetical protein